MRSRLALLPLALTVLSLTGCQGHSKSEKYLLIAGNTKLPYWKTVSEGFMKAAADYNVTAQVQGPEGDDPGAEADAFASAADSKPAGIVISVLDANRMRPAIDKAMRSGVPVITLDSDAPESSRLFFIGTNNYQAGTLGGRRLEQLLGGKGNVVFFTFATQPNLTERLKGYMDAISSHGGIRVVEVVDIKGDSGTAFDKARQYAGRTGADRIDAFVSLDSASGKDVSDALKRAGVSDRKIIAMDVNTDVLNLIKSGDIQATISQKPYTMGYIGLQQLALIHADDRKGLNGHQDNNPHSLFPASIDTGTAVVDKDNVDAYLSPSSSAASQ